ncbi:MAG: hypothetical protein DHS20C11_15390 [Lysobacteraceae bacterium]|nr:MAG: hypothetical protein DHS20C11_15390 [Xanthomonadaceae bacterium]
MRSVMRIVLTMALLPACADAGDFNPEGLYAHTPSIGGLSAVTIQSAGAPNEYLIATLNGRGFRAVIDDAGQISTDEFGVVGAFDGADSVNIQLPEGVPSEFVLTRMVFTDSDFLKFDPRALAVDAANLAEWDIHEQLFHPVTGDEEFLQFPFFDSVMSSHTVDGVDTLRSTESFKGGLLGYFQGTMPSHRQWVVQVGDPVDRQFDPELAWQTRTGHDTSYDLRFIGKGRFEDINTFTTTVFVENASGGSRPLANGYLLFLQTLERKLPLLPGDLNGNGLVGNADRNALSSLFGLDEYQQDYRLLADITLDGIVDLRDLAALDGEVTTLVPIEAGHSGSWVNIDRNGEGWNIAILPGGKQAALGFFTYGPDGQTHVWVVGLGDIRGNEIYFDELTVTSGTTFGDFDPASVVRVNWGSVRVYFTGCNQGVLSFAGPDGFFNDARPIARLTSLAGLGCGGSIVVSHPAQSTTGTWGAEGRDGEGFLFEALPDGRVALYWYSYAADQPLQFWLGGLGVFDADTNTITFDSLEFITDLSFGGSPPGQSIDQVRFGSASFQQTTCDQGIFSFVSDHGDFEDDSFTLDRVFGVEAVDCDPEQFAAD